MVLFQYNHLIGIVEETCIKDFLSIIHTIKKTWSKDQNNKDLS